jgi:amidase
MARTVRDAATALGALVGIDPSDSKTLASQGNSYQDYTQFLDKDALKGKRLGFYTRPMGENYKVDELMNETLEYLKSQGVEIVELDQIQEESLGSAPFDLMLYEFKDGLNKYFSSLGENAPIKNIEELIAFNEADSIELRYYDQELILLSAKKGSLEDEEYLKAVELVRKSYQEGGIDRIMDMHKLDAIIAPTGSPAWKTDLVNGDHFQLGSSSPAARAGYPNITVPMGEVDGLPVGVSFFGKAWSEPVLIGIAYSFEQGTQKRIVPQFKEH